MLYDFDGLFMFLQQMRIKWNKWNLDSERIRQALSYSCVEMLDALLSTAAATSQK